MREARDQNQGTAATGGGATIGGDGAIGGLTGGPGSPFC